jgi:hypothetical protein
MATIITGNPGERWQNDGGKVQYQLVVAFINSCGFCIQYHHAIANYWPIPFHPRCNCRAVPIAPGQSAEPFADFEAEIEKLPHERQVEVIGDGAWKLIQDGQIKWEDAVTKTRIKSLYEIARDKNLSISDMKKAGISEATASRAYLQTRTPAQMAMLSAQKAAYQKLIDMGYTPEQIQQMAVQRISSMFGLVGAPNRAGSWLAPQNAPAITPNAAPSPKTTIASTPSPTPSGPPNVVGNGSRNGFPKFYPPSAAKVDATPETITAASVLLGTPVKAATLASLIGAPAMATVKVTLADDRLEITAADSRINEQRVTVSKQANGKLKAEIEAWDFKTGSRAMGAFGNLVKNAFDLGIDKITVNAQGPADGGNGYWAWPEFGFDARLTADQRKALQDLPVSFRNARTVQDLISTPAGALWWHANGSSIKAEFDLSEGSRSLKRWQVVEQELMRAQMNDRKKKGG